MSTRLLESIMSKTRAFFANGGVKTLVQFGAIVFAAGILWAKVAALETQVLCLTADVRALITHLLNKP